MSFKVYNASAGSGKTYTLTKEYLKILFQAHSFDKYRRILAITFTNKAVEEMKSRIVDNLIAFSQDEVSEKTDAFMKEIAAEIGSDVATLKEKSKKIVKTIIHNYAAFDISTIDKFTHRVIRTFANDLNLPTNFDVTLETENLLRNAIDTVIAKAGEDEELTQVLINFAKSKIDDDKNWDVTNDLYDVCQLILNEEHFFNFNQFQDKSIEDFTKIATNIKSKFETNSSKIKEISGLILKDFEINAISEADFSRGTFFRHIQNIFELNPKAYEYDFVSLKEIDSPAKSKNKDIVENLKEKWKELLAQIYQLNKENNLFELVLSNMVPLSLIHTVYKEYKQLQEDQNVLSISDFNTIINREIKDQPAPFIYERLGDRYRHYFIDEFQDTSEMQWQNFVPLIDNALASEDMDGTRGSLMIVGDPKQSIYRWRGGKAEQFIRLSGTENPFSNDNKEVKNLDTNYRSYSQIIAFNNDFFQHIAHEFTNEDYLNLYKETASQKTNSKKGGFVSIQFLEDNDNLIEEEFNDDDEISEKDKKHLVKTLEIIEQVKNQGFDYNDIVLLTRKTKQGVLLANYLTEKNIPILSSDTLLIQNASEVKFIIHFLEYLDSHFNQESKINWLYYVANQTVQPTEIHDFIFEAKDLNEKDLEQFLARYNYTISFSDSRKKSLYEAVEKIIATFLPEKTTISYVQYFLDLVLERDMKYQSSTSDFLEYWERVGFKQSIPSPEGEQAVRIITIHKSKGLEFPVVIYPFADDSTKPIDPKVWIPIEEEGIDMKQALVKKTKKLETINDETKTVFETKTQEEILDMINVIYVALTRAEEQLYIISSFGVTSKGVLSTKQTVGTYFTNYLQEKGLFTINQKTYNFGSSQRVSSPKTIVKQQETIKNVQKHLNFSSIKIAKREALMWGTTQENAIEFGNIVHELLSFVKYKTDVDRAIIKGLESGLFLYSQKEIFHSILYKIVFHPELEVFFNDKAIVFNENNIVSPNETNLKPDRVVLLNNEAYLLDYKTGEHQSKYEKQLETYTRVIEKMEVKVVKKILLYIGDDIKLIHL
ncbi:Probable ATP-dependent DNA helicase, UvrD/REP family [Flavobacterium indicum GPTSA100-9 = DSM 17447]|uniref:DNA 3'-5' helicase n=1 Tax=Flavobacterium indicum (strain DSM 17447 / CIP 109464 / GPTSA100-9) TaxID=1094466 RepID=H8XS05_FLAIG|nr:UvrD-helicase domain-containing protein [Flavobacterium indicum]CCG54589.1 Probable ATP-dependent DNA helicase, UvrD/REP family [Flavobacterium indicum GPTSA100-9 = DSM 17447]